MRPHVHVGVFGALVLGLLILAASLYLVAVVAAITVIALAGVGVRALIRKARQ